MVSSKLARAFRSTMLVASLLACHAAVQAQSDEDASSKDELADDLPPAPPRERPQPRSMQAVLQVGGGITQRSIELAHWLGRMKLNSGLAAAMDMRVTWQLTGSGYFLRARASYQTSLGLVGGDRLRSSAQPAATTPLRSHRFEVGAVPGVWLGAGPGSAAIGLFIAYAGRAFGSVTELLIPRYTLHGPLLRLELEVPLWKRVSLRLAPEATLIVSVTDALRRAGTLDPWGFGIGGEGSLHARFSPRLSARLAYREARAYVSASATLSARLVDVERYVLLDALVRY